MYIYYYIIFNELIKTDLDQKVSSKHQISFLTLKEQIKHISRCAKTAVPIVVYLLSEVIDFVQTSENYGEAELP